jgi:hypothetical protein
MNIGHWQETYDGGSPEAEKAIFLELAEQMLAIQEANRKKSGYELADRTLHAKMIVGVTDATLTVDAALPEQFHVGHFRPGATLHAAVRFSNASPLAQPDTSPDMRGAALKIRLPGEARRERPSEPESPDVHDLLMTNYPVSHARNARQFVNFAVLAQGPRETFAERLAQRFGEGEARRMLDNVRHGARVAASLALERFWSRGAILWGAVPVRFELRPAFGASTPAERFDGEHALRDEFARRLSTGDVTFRLALQRFVDEARTPIEDASTPWQEADSPPVEIATLTISRRSLDSDDAKQQAQAVADMAFNPWHAPASFRPLGNLNRVRGVVYSASAQRWQAPRMRHHRKDAQ